MNFAKTALLLAGLTALFMGVGYLIGGSSGMMIAFLVALGTNAFAYWNSGDMVLRMYNAHEVDARTAPEYYGIVQRLAANAGLPMPRVFVIESPQPNAFATGRNPQHAAVAASTGLLQTLTPDEIAGVMAHELAHVKHYDTLTMTVTATLAGAISMLANFAFFFGGNRNNGGGMIGSIAIMLLAPFAAMIVQMAISRSREYEADRGGAEICGNPLALATALRKIALGAERVPNMEAEHNPATAHMFIVNPLSGQRMDNLFSTHPDTGNRIAALEDMARHMRGNAPSYGTARAASEPVQHGPWGNAGASGAEARRGPWG